MGSHAITWLPRGERMRGPEGSRPSCEKKNNWMELKSLLQVYNSNLGCFVDLR